MTLRRRCQHFPQHQSENTPNEHRGTSATCITNSTRPVPDNDRAPWKKYNPLWALRGNRKCRTEERQPGEGMELITILEKTVSPGESLHHAPHTAGDPDPMPNPGPGGAVFARRRAAPEHGGKLEAGRRETMLAHCANPLALRPDAAGDLALFRAFKHTLLALVTR